MKKKILTIISICIVLIIGGVLIWYFTNKTQLDNTFVENQNIKKENNETEIISTDRVIIKNGNITNENLINEFMAGSNKDNRTLEIEEETGITKLEFIKQEIQTEFPQEDGSTTVKIPEYMGNMSRDFDVDYAAKYYGYYKVTYSDGTIKKYSPLSHNIKKAINNGNVIVYFNIWLPTVDLIARPDELYEICRYNVESSNYKNNLNLTYNPRRDMGIKQIANIGEFDNADYKIYTFGGDVTVTIEDNIELDLRQALTEKKIKAEDIMKQVKLDNEYGICNDVMYKDGGSIEYLYDSYTILKCNTSGDNKDLYIGMKGTILSQINKINKN